MQAKEKIKISVIGLGYVGLPLAVEFAKKGFEVLGIDKLEEKADKINKAENYIKDVEDDVLKELVNNKKLSASSDFTKLNSVDVCILCVPTPLNRTWEPDMSFIISATEEVEKNIKKGTLIVLESTTYPGTTEEMILPILTKNGKKLGEDFYLAFSPERVDPGNEKFKTNNIPKIMGGVDKKSLDIAVEVYSKVLDKVVPVSSAKVAEMSKLLENTFRTVNIGLINEIALMCNEMGVDVWEVIDAAATKPFGFMPFYPGPGLGGHCLPIDPLYLAWKAKFYNFETKFINLAMEVNRNMPAFVVKKITDSLNLIKKSINGSKILILGTAYKNDIDDLRESPALTIMQLLEEKGAELVYCDPYIEEVKLNKISLKSEEITEDLLKQNDCSVILTNHKVFDYEKIVKYSNIIIDTRNALKDVKQNRDKIIKL
jgi:UDP-N-acetyl-D-glucosamine dehydrogenase